MTLDTAEKRIATQCTLSLDNGCVCQRQIAHSQELMLAARELCDRGASPLVSVIDVLEVQGCL